MTKLWQQIVSLFPWILFLAAVAFLGYYVYRAYGQEPNAPVWPIADPNGDPNHIGEPNEMIPQLSPQGLTRVRFLCRLWLDDPNAACNRFVFIPADTTHQPTHFIAEYRTQMSDSGFHCYSYIVTEPGVLTFWPEKKGRSWWTLPEIMRAFEKMRNDPNMWAK